MSNCFLHVQLALKQYTNLCEVQSSQRSSSRPGQDRRSSSRVPHRRVRRKRIFQQFTAKPAATAVLPATAVPAAAVPATAVPTTTAVPTVLPTTGSSTPTAAYLRAATGSKKREPGLFDCVLGSYVYLLHFGHAVLIAALAY